MKPSNAEEAAVLASVLADIQQRSKRRQPPALDGLILQWSVFVQEIEKGYELSIYEYTNDLSTRDLLEEIMARVPEPLRSEILATVQPWDDRYRLATRPSALPVAPGVSATDARWWWRIPRKLAGELRDDLKTEGLLGD